MPKRRLVIEFDRSAKIKYGTSRIKDVLAEMVHNTRRYTLDIPAEVYENGNGHYRPPSHRFRTTYRFDLDNKEYRQINVHGSLLRLADLEFIMGYQGRNGTYYGIDEKNVGMIMVKRKNYFNNIKKDVRAFRVIQDDL